MPDYWTILSAIEQKRSHYKNLNKPKTKCHMKFLNFLNSDFNAFGNNKSCLREIFGFKRYFLSNLYHIVKA